jgi:glucose dehydrogenase
VTKEVYARTRKLPRTGQLLWYKQFVPHDVHDYDLTHTQPVIKTKSRTLIVTTSKELLPDLTP